MNSKDIFKQHALSNITEEVVAIEIDDKISLGINTHANKYSDFQLDTDSTLAIYNAIEDGQQVSVYHSHVNGNPFLSPADVINCKAVGYKVLMYCVATDTWDEYDPTLDRDTIPYEGREWHYVTQNCYSLTQDFYRKEFDIKLADFYLYGPSEWTEPTWNRYMENIESQGFVQVYDDTEPAYGDYLLFRIGASSPNHAAVLLQPETNTILHHLVNRYSCVDTYRGKWKKLQVSRWKHRDLLYI